ncbi:helix-turn-helix domain-containing protein [uncultured Phascolarctobacterium sp.]|uniref:helix-turn-helix domain-containing protein n=1 Tax=uncultured Phascolarctobacterium sp. TaxID=512296 RepID=UPI0026134896|nr:helix-turn-helix domain-containing protein [uncultured Phascolarctobacterium sp.]
MNTDFKFLFESATPQEINIEIANRIRAIRRRRKISQERLSEQSGVSLGSVKRFERSGDISLLSLSKIAIALGIEKELQNLFVSVPFQSIEEIKNAEDNKS